MPPQQMPPYRREQVPPRWREQQEPSRRRDLQRQRDRQGRLLRRFYLLTGLSTLFAGAGLLATRRRGLGISTLTVFGLGLVVMLWQAGDKGLVTFVLGLAVRRDMLLALMVIAVLGAALWCVAILSTAAVTRPRYLGSRDRFLTRAFTVAACVLVVVPTFQAVRYMGIQTTVIGEVFQGSGDQPVFGTDEDAWEDRPRVNVLLLGSDAGADREGVRTDSMIVASINTHTGDTVLVGLPRNLENVPFPKSSPLHALYPNGYTCPDAAGAEQCLLNAVWREADTNHPELFQGVKNPGLTTLKGVITEATGLHVDRTVVIDLAGFQALVDAMGGIDINAKSRICVGCKSDGAGGIIWASGREQWIEPGKQHLNGYRALWYARSRAQGDDYDRMRRQRCVVGALLQQVNPGTMLQRYPALAEVAKDNISVDISHEELTAWVVLVERIQKGGVRSLPITDKVVDVSNPDFEALRALIKKSVHPPAKKPSGSATSSPTPTTGTATPRPRGSTSTAPDDNSASDITAAC